MRTLRTEIYFDPSEVNSFDGFADRGEFSGKNPGVAFAWFRSGSPIDASQISSLDEFKQLRRDYDKNLDLDDIDGILDLFIRGSGEPSFSRLPSSRLVENRDLIDFLYGQEIVMENSPPFSFSLKVLLDKANTPLWIGTFMGTAVAWGHPVLLFITVPGGIIVVSSASGIGRAMEAGLNKAVDRLFKTLK